MKNFKWRIFISLMILLFLPAQGELSEERIKGFTVDSSREERQIETALKKLADPKVYEKHLRFLTEEPHIAGTKRNYDLAVYIRDKFKEFGLEDVELVEYQVLLSYPKEIIVEMVEPLVFKATLREEGYPVDKDSFDSQVSIGFNAYSASGEVTAPVVYAHGGNPEDYDRLLEMGIDISRNQKTERDFGFPGGIPKRPWYKHLIYACKFTYDPEVLPGLTEAVEEKDWARAKEQISLLDKAVSRSDRTLQEVLTRILENQKGEYINSWLSLRFESPQ